MSHPQDLSLCEQARAVSAGTLDPAELLAATLGRIDEHNGALNAVAATFPAESARMLAAAPRGPLFGVPVTVKDMYALPWRGFRNGTRREFGPAMASGVFRRLRDAGAVVVGVNNQHELGLGSTGLASAYGPVANPWDRAHCAGGSSSGPAASVAARWVAGAVGSDSGGSARIPAGWCGVVGLKLTYRSVPYDGYNGANSTFSAPGVFARDTADARLLTEALLARPMAAADAGPVDIAVVRRPHWENLDPEVEAACTAALRATGLPIREIEMPQAELSFAAAIRVAVELGAVVPDDLLPELAPATRAWIQFAALQPAARLERADRLRAGIRRELAAVLRTGSTVLAWPTTPAPAPPVADPVLRLPAGPVPPDVPTIQQSIVANVAGIPGVSVPIGLHSTGLPVGIQLLGPWGGEALLLAAAQRIEDAQPGSASIPDPRRRARTGSSRA